MKKKLLILAAAVCLILIFALSAGAAVPGDVSGDGVVSAEDARYALRCAVHLENYAKGSEKYNACDVDKDGNVTAGDARKILRAAVGLEDLSSDAPATDAPKPANPVPGTKKEICNFYAKAVNDIRNNGSASYNKKEYQTVTNFNITGNGIVDGIIKNIAGNYFKDESKADLQVAEKGADSSRSKMLGWTLTDLSKVTSATLAQNGGNYDITIRMADEDTPHKGGNSHLAAVGSVLLWEDIEAELNGISQLKEWQGNIHVVYTNYTITATISPDGKLIALRHHTDIDIRIGHAKISILTLENKNVTMENTVNFTDFVY